MKTVFRYIAALALAGLVAGCGGGGDEPAALSPQKVAKAQRAQVSTSSITSAAAADLLMDAAEIAYPAYFPGHKETMLFSPFAFRYYPETGMYIGVVTSASAQYPQLNGIYVVGPGFGTLANPSFQGLVTQYLPVVIGDGGDDGTTYRTLSITVTVYGQPYTVQVGSVPLPVAEVDFCTGLYSDPTVVQLLASYGASFVIDGCSFSGTTGSFSGTVTVAGYGAVPFSVTYAYL
jgi:hypothetical protein